MPNDRSKPRLGVTLTSQNLPRDGATSAVESRFFLFKRYWVKNLSDNPGRVKGDSEDCRIGAKWMRIKQSHALQYPTDCHLTGTEL